MSEHLKVKVLKKSKDAPYPEHIIVERKSTNELVHLYFDNGDLAKLTHIERDTQTETTQDGKASLPNYVVTKEISFKKNANKQDLEFLKGLNNQNFFTLLDSSAGEKRSVAFKSEPDGFTDFYIALDSSFRCIPYTYIADCGVADIKEIYPHQKRKVPSISKLIVNELIKSK